MSMIHISNLTKTFVTGIRRKKKQAVKDVTLSIESGEIFGIIGVNGAGKSSVLKMILGFINPDSGLILISDRKPSDPESRKQIGYLPENPYFYDHLTAEELLGFGASASGLDRRETRQRSDELLKRVNLFEEKKQKLRSYSKGMTQRAGICYALVHDPQIVILDEPMSGLDPLGRKMMIDLILDLKKKGKTVLFCSHILSDVERICDRVAIMDQGQVKSILTRQDILSREKQVDIRIDRVTDTLRSRLKETSCILFESEESLRVECPEREVDFLFSVIRAESIRVVHIDSSVNLMERIFLDAIGRRS